MGTSGQDRRAELAGLRVCVLGGLRLELDDFEIPVRGVQRNLVVAMLARHAGTLVSVSSLVDCIDPDARRVNATNAIQAHIRRIRSEIEPGVDARAATRLRTIGDGYQLMPDEFDLWDYRDHVRRARSLVRTDPISAIGEYRQAIDMWADPLGSLGQHPRFIDFSSALEVDHLDVQDDWIDACITATDGGVESRLLETVCGSRLTVVDEVALVASSHPTREGRGSMAMHLLYRAGRQAEALRLFDSIRVHLRDELGLDPGPELRRMQDRILSHDPSLLGSSTAGPVRLPGRRGLSKSLDRDDRSLSTSIPGYETGFVGRERLCDTISELSRRPDLVSLTGMAGVGKTRLAAHWSVNYCDLDSVVWVSVSAEENSVVTALCREVHLGVGPDLAEARAAAIELLPRSAAALVIDGAEAALDDVVQLIVDVRMARRDMFVLVTSQVPLGLPGEHVVPVPLLDVPQPDGPTEGPAVELLLSAAKGREGQLANGQLREVVLQSGGLPLALELAATGAVPPVDSGFGDPDGTNVPSASGALSVAVGRARDRVAPAARELLDMCCLLPSGVATPMVQWWRDRDRPDGVADQWEYRRLLTELVESTLVRVPPGMGTARHCAINQVRDLLDRDMGTRRRTVVMDRYVRWLEDLLSDPAFTLRNTSGPDGDGLPCYLIDQPTFGLLTEESANVDAAMTYQLQKSASAGAGLLSLLVPYFRRVAGRSVGRSWADRVLGESELDEIDRARSEVARVFMCPDLASVASMHDEIESNVSRMRKLDLVDGDWWMLVNMQLAIAKGWRRDFRAVRDAVAEARRAGGEREWSQSLIDRYWALMLFVEGDVTAAVKLAWDASARLEAIGDTHEALGALFFILTMSRTAGLDVAPEVRERSMRLSVGSRQFYSSLILAEHAAHALGQGGEEAVEMLGEAATRLEQDGLLRTAASTRKDLGLLLVERGRHDEALVHLSRAAEMLLVMDVAGASLALAGLAVCAATMNRSPSHRYAERLVDGLATTALELTRGGGTPPTAQESRLLERLVGVARRSAGGTRAPETVRSSEHGPVPGAGPSEMIAVVERARRQLGELARL